MCNKCYEHIGIYSNMICFYHLRGELQKYKNTKIDECDHLQHLRPYLGQCGDVGFGRWA